MISAFRVVMSAALILIALVTSSVVKANDEIALHTLDNGLKVAFVADESDHFLLQIGVGAGFIDEKPGEEGGFHWLEHMFFRGTEELPNRELFQAELDRLGIEYNASTTFESTSFFFIVPKEHFKEAMHLFATMIAKPKLDPLASKSELEPVKQEARRDKVDPNFELFTSALTLHGKSPRMKSLMGGSIAQMDAQPADLPRRLKDRMYSANNMVFAVVGPIADIDEAVAITTKEFSQIPSFQVPPRGSFKLELNAPEKFKLMKQKAEAGTRPALNIGFPLARNGQNEAAATILAQYLNHADSPITALLRKNGLVTSVSAGMITLHDVISLNLVLNLTDRGEQSLDRVNNILAAVLGSLQKTSISDEMLAEIKHEMFAGPVEAESENSGAKQKEYSSSQIADLIIGAISEPGGEKDIMRKQKALVNTSRLDVLWLLGQMPIENAQLTLRTENAKGELNTAIEREVEEVDLTSTLPALQQIVQKSTIQLPEVSNSWLSTDAPRELNKTIEVVGTSQIKRVRGVHVVVFPQPVGSDANAYLEFRFPKSRMSAQELVAIEVAMKTFEIHPANALFFDQIRRAGIGLGYRFDKSEMRLMVQASGPANRTARALNEFLMRFRGFKPTANLVRNATQELDADIRALPLAEVSRQAVSAGIKKLTGGRFIDMNEKRKLLKTIELPMVEKLMSSAQEHFEVRGVLSTPWEDATYDRLESLLQPPKPLFVKYPAHHEDASSHTYNTVEPVLSGVKRQGVASLYPVSAAANSRTEVAMQVVAQALSGRLMAVVRTEMQLAYNVSAGYVRLRNGGVLYLTGDTSFESLKMIEGYNRVMTEFLKHGMNDDEFRNALSSALDQFRARVNSTPGQFESIFEKQSDVNEAFQQASTLTASEVMLVARAAIAQSRPLHSLVIGPEDPICEQLLLNSVMPARKVLNSH